MIPRRLLLYAALAFGGCSRTPKDRSEAGRTRTEHQPSSSEKSLFEAVNNARASRGVPPLVWHDGAAEAARSHSRNMAGRGFFSHVDPRSGGLQKRLSAAGVPWTATAENILQQKGYENSVHQAVTSWLQSDGHRLNLLNETYTHTGVGIATGQDGTTYYTQIFLRE